MILVLWVSSLVWDVQISIYEVAVYASAHILDNAFLMLVERSMLQSVGITTRAAAQYISK
jgi:hypothetical protein